MTNDLLQIICHFNLHLKGFRCFYLLIYVQYTICNHLFEKVKKSVLLFFYPSLCMKSFFPQCTMYQCPTTWLYMDIYIEKTINTRLRWIKENTLLNRQCNHTITSKRHWAADSAFIYNFSIRWQCWSMWSFVLRFGKSCEPFSGLQTLCAHLCIYTSTF